jgi:hypothetical protein
MKRLLVLVLALGAVAAAQPQCTTNSIVGTYVTSYSGWVTMEQPGAAPITFFGTIFGVASIDYGGNVTGTSAISGFGPVTDYVNTGTAEIKPDCTGTLRMSSKPKGSKEPAMPEVHRFVFISSEKKILATIVDMGPGTYPAVLGEWKFIAPVPNAVTW